MIVTQKRKQLIGWLFEQTQRIYIRLFKKNEAWEIVKKDLLNYEKQSLGYHLGAFLDKNGFDLIPQVERHDVYHVITGYDTKAEDEIALQYLCFGNGKRSPYLFGVMILGTCILPDYWGYYIRSYKQGKMSNSFHHFDFKKLLTTPLADLRKAFFSKSYINLLNT